MSEKELRDLINTSFDLAEKSMSSGFKFDFALGMTSGIHHTLLAILAGEPSLSPKWAVMKEYEARRAAFMDKHFPHTKEDAA